MIGAFQASRPLLGSLHVASASAAYQLLSTHQGIQSAALLAGCSSDLRSCGRQNTYRFGNAASASTDAKPSGGQGDQPKSSGLAAVASFTPSWLRKWFLPAATESTSTGVPAVLSPRKASDTAAAVPATADNKKEAEEALEQMRKAKDADVDGFIEQCRENRIAQPPPRPRFPSLPANHPGFKLFLDFRRIAYLRTCQMEAIAQRMTAEDKVLVKAAADNALAAARGWEPAQSDILKDKELLERIAERTNGKYMHLEVKDCISAYIDSRVRAARLHYWAVDLKNGVPREAQLASIDKEMKQDERREKQLRLRSLRETSGCPVAPKLAWAGPQTHCSLSGLAYWQCCGGGRVEPRALVLKRVGAEPHLRGGIVVLGRQRPDKRRMLRPFRSHTRRESEPKFVQY